MLAALASIALAASALQPAQTNAAPVLAADATAREMAAACRRMLPQTVEISGGLVLRNRRGTVMARHSYVLNRRDGAVSLAVDGAPLERGEAAGPIMGTDVTWSDLTLEYLWWDDVSFDEEKEGETVHGQVCSVIVLANGGRRVRAWIDRKTGAMMQAEEISDGRAVRRLWGTRIRKFGDRWAPNVLEVETLGSGHRTKITIDKLKVEEKK